MSKKETSARDAFTLSLGGMRTISSHAMAPAIDFGRLHQVEVDSDQPHSPKATLASFGRFWLHRAGQ